MIEPNTKREEGFETSFEAAGATREVADGAQALDPSNEASGQRHLATGHLLKNLRQRTISSGIITIGAQIAQFVLSMGSIMILARLLTPHDFGLLAMVMTLTGYLRIFKDAGLSTATVQREGITHAQVSNLFWINLALGASMSVIFALCAPAIAWFYREPRLSAITFALSLTFVLEGSVAQHLAILNRQMRFTVLAVIQIVSMMAGIALAIAMAWLACGYWSLVALQLTTPIVAMILIWLATPWRPQLPTRASGTRSLVNFGANMAASGLIWTLARSTDGILIGKFFGSNSLGLYSRSAALLHRPLEQLLGPIDKVFVPMFCRIQSEPERYRRTLLQVFETVALVSFLFTGLILALARPLTLLLLGPKWTEAVPIFSAFAIGAVFLPLSWASTWLFISQARGRDWLIANTFVSATAVCAMIAGVPFGPAGVAFAYSVSGLLVMLPIMYHVAGREGPVSSKDLWRATLTHVPIWGITCGATYLIRTNFIGFRPLAQLAICAPLGLLAGGTLLAAYPPSRRVALQLYTTLKRKA
jgi:PST family polysaccharide transporter